MAGGPIRLTDILAGTEILINPLNITKVIAIEGGSSVFLTTNNWNVDVSETLDQIEKKWKQSEHGHGPHSSE